ncbi:hypothetical protein QP027_08835 [Corynebacterium breve]|uniref:Uncharacterized protein n=1 Tax=Corynebacterium breve TaxID=3049799 RepID=A0ABY8VI41_9CORY|nr:hypothetical protein [Corynebacterium breve]WIM67220.1 hypothetical protein QP027_08835 [Corynebacterium breve]
MSETVQDALDAVTQVEQRITKQTPAWAIIVVSIITGAFFAALTWKAWITVVVIFVVFCATLFVLRNILFPGPFRRLGTREDPFDDPSIRGSWNEVIIYVAMTGFIYMAPEHSLPATAIAGILGAALMALWIRKVNQR